MYIALYLATCLHRDKYVLLYITLTRENDNIYFSLNEMLGINKIYIPNILLICIGRVQINYAFVYINCIYVHLIYVFKVKFCLRAEAHILPQLRTCESIVGWFLCHHTSSSYELYDRSVTYLIDVIGTDPVHKV